MVKWSVFFIGIAVTIVLLTSCNIQSSRQPSRPAAQISQEAIASVNCGPKILLEICNIYNIFASEEELTTLSETKNGVSSLWGLSNAIKAKGLDCVGAEIDFENLKKLSKDNLIITHLSQNYHFVLVKEVKDRTIAIYDPTLSGNKNPDVPIHLFLDDWDGNALIINKELKDIIG